VGAGSGRPSSDKAQLGRGTTSPGLLYRNQFSVREMVGLKINTFTTQLLNAIQHQNGRELGNRYLNVQHSDASELYVGLPQNDTNLNFVSDRDRRLLVFASAVLTRFELWFVCRRLQRTKASSGAWEHPGPRSQNITQGWSSLKR